MDRRDLLRLAAVGAGALAGGNAAGDDDKGDAKMADEPTLAAPCGLFCGVCDEVLVTRSCHGCGCGCGRCAGKPHADSCAIARCASEQGFRTCAQCPQMPCTKLIQFCHDPIWRTHGPVIENLRRQAMIGIDAWVAEQKEYWSDEGNRKRWHAFGAECAEKWRKQKKTD